MTKRTPLSLDPLCLCEWEVETRGHVALETEGDGLIVKLSKEREREVE